MEFADRMNTPGRKEILEQAKRRAVIARLTDDDRGGLCFAAVAQCWICGGPTHRVSLAFESHLCYRCDDKADDHYWDAVALDSMGPARFNHDACSLCGTMSRANR